MTALLSVAAILLYLLAGGLLLWAHTGNPPALWRRRWHLAAVAGLAFHGVAGGNDVAAAGALNLGFFSAFSATTWLIAVLWLLTNVRRPVSNLGLVVMPLAALGALLALIFPPAAPARPLAAGVELHVIVSLVAYSFLAVAAAQSAILALQDHRLHQHHPTRFVRALPPLQVMERILFQLIGVGFVLLTLALLTGFVFIEDLFAQHLVHKTVLSVVAWLIFGTLLLGRWRYGWRGATAIRWTIAGFVVLAIGYFGSKMVLELILGRA